MPDYTHRETRGEFFLELKAPDGWGAMFAERAMGLLLDRLRRERPLEEQDKDLDPTLVAYVIFFTKAMAWAVAANLPFALPAPGAQEEDIFLGFRHAMEAPRQFQYLIREAVTAVEQPLGDVDTAPLEVSPEPETEEEQEKKERSESPSMSA